MLNLLLGAGVLLGLLFAVWVAWTYHRYGRLKNVSGVITMVAIIASLPLGVQLVRERTRLLTQAANDVTVTAVQVESQENKRLVVYITLSDAGFAYMEANDPSNKQVVMSQGKVEPRIGHSFVIENPVKYSGKTFGIFVNGLKDDKEIRIP